jgi:hypothetical protein
MAGSLRDQRKSTRRIGQEHQLHVLRKALSLWLAAYRDGQRQTTAEGLRLHIPRARLMP